MNWKIGNILILPIFLMAHMCTETDCEALLAPLTDLEQQYGCSDTKVLMDIDLQDDWMLIDNQAEYDNLVSGTCQPEINFDYFTLLIGKKNLISGNDRIEYDQTYHCNNGILTITFTFIQNETDEAPNLTYHVLIPGKPYKSGLRVEHKVIEPGN